MMGGERRSIGSIIGIVILTILVGIKGLSAQESVNSTCLTTMATCLEESSSLLDCCSIIKDAILEERDCFCLTKEIFRDNATLATNWATMLTICSITASLDSLCPDSNSSLSVPPSSTPESPPPSIEVSPTESPVTPPIESAPAPSSPVENLFPPTPGPPSPTDLLFPPTPEQPATDDDTNSHESGDENKDDRSTSIGGGSNAAKKIGYPMVLLSSSALFIWAMILLS